MEVNGLISSHDDVIKWKHFPRNWPCVRGIHRSPVNSPRKGQWRGALMFSLICVWINDWVNNREAGDLRRYRAHYDVIVMAPTAPSSLKAHHSYWHLLQTLQSSEISGPYSEYMVPVPEKSCRKPEIFCLTMSVFPKYAEYWNFLACSWTCIWRFGPSLQTNCLQRNFIWYMHSFSNEIVWVFSAFIFFKFK